MKKIILIHFALICLFACQNIFSTNVSGSIHTNTTWSLANSPYHVTGNVIVFPGNKLTIEPGVMVIFDGNYELEIRGELDATGTSTANICFTGEMVITGSDTAYVHWKRIFIEPNNKGKGFFTYCCFKDAQVAIYKMVTDQAISDCLFEYNDTAISYFNEYVTTYAKINDCIFRDNGIGVFWAKYTLINNCQFIRNNEGVALSFFCNIFESQFSNNGNGINYLLGNIKNSTFTYNTCGIRDFNASSSFKTDTLSGCTIQYNTCGIDDSAEWCGDNGVIINNDISYNKVGIKTLHAGDFVPKNINYTPIIRNNTICSNTLYNVINRNNMNKNFTNNCFCTDDSAEIEDKLFDGYDDASFGLLTYNIYGEDCDQKQENVFKKLTVEPKDTGCSTFKGCDLNTGLTKLTSKQGGFRAFPVPFDRILQIDLDQIVPSFITVTDIYGKEIYRIEGNIPDTFSIDTENWSNGVYMISIHTLDNVYSGKILKN